MSPPERPCDTFRRAKIKDCNDIKALASDGGKCFLKFIKKYLNNYAYRVIIMQNYSKIFTVSIRTPQSHGGWETNLESRTIYEREENNYEAKGIH